MASIFDIIKKQNGEKFAKTIRAYDNGIFDIPNIDQIVKFAGNDAEPIMEYLVSLKNVQIRESGVMTDPFTLLYSAGYTAEYADTLCKQNSIKKYFAPDEELCTFKDDDRYEKYYIINAVKIDVDKIRRENFPNPQREDEYGTSVLSIQIRKDGGFISIKNRYNHKVDNPDNTYNSNPDNIISGLGDSLRKHFNVDFSSQKVNIFGDYRIVDGKIIKFNYEINGGYIGRNFYVKDGVIHELNPTTHVMLDYFILQIYPTKELINPLGAAGFDSFSDLFKTETDNKKIRVVKNADITTVFADADPIFKLDADNKIIAVNAQNTTHFGDDCFRNNEVMTSFDAPNATHFGDNCFGTNRTMTSFDAQNAIHFGDDCFSCNSVMTSFNAPNAIHFGDKCFYFSKSMTSFDAPKATHFGDSCFYSNEVMTGFNAPNATYFGDGCFYFNKTMIGFDAPNATHFGNKCFYCNEVMTSFNAPNAIRFGDDCFNCNKAMTSFDAPKATHFGKECFYNNEIMTSFNAPKATHFGYSCFFFNKAMTSFDAPKATHFGNNCFYYNEVMKEKIKNQSRLLTKKAKWARTKNNLIGKQSKLITKNPVWSEIKNSLFYKIND